MCGSDDALQSIHEIGYNCKSLYNDYRLYRNDNTTKRGLCRETIDRLTLLAFRYKNIYLRDRGWPRVAAPHAVRPITRDASDFNVVERILCSLHSTSGVVQHMELCRRHRRELLSHCTMCYTWC